MRLLPIRRRALWVPLAGRCAVSTDQDLRHVLETADHCHGLVVRDGVEDACGKPPVAIIDARDVEDGCYWPACAYHAHRYGRGKCVPLSVLVHDLKGAQIGADVTKGEK